MIVFLVSDSVPDAAIFSSLFCEVALATECQGGRGFRSPSASTCAGESGAAETLATPSSVFIIVPIAPRPGGEAFAHKKGAFECVCSFCARL
jgi:hypothetical protein